MLYIKDYFNYYSSKIDILDLELIISHVLKKPREFVLSHPKFKIPTTYLPRRQAGNSQLTTFIKRRLKGEPLAYILGEKEFYGLRFEVNKNVLIPRPETEMLVELALQELTASSSQPTTLLDLGTGSGNIIISVARNMKHKIRNKINFYGIDVSNKALKVAKQNAKLHKVGKKIKFLQENLLSPALRNKLLGIKSPSDMDCDRNLYQMLSCSKKKYSMRNTRYIILANLPYLSPKIYNNTPKSVKNYEPKKALLSQKNGLEHYEKLFKQISNIKCQVSLPKAGPPLAENVKCFFEHSPEQKPALQKLIKKYFPEAEIKFYKDLAGKWRVCEVKIKN